MKQKGNMYCGIDLKGFVVGGDCFSASEAHFICSKNQYNGESGSRCFGRWWDITHFTVIISS